MLAGMAIASCKKHLIAPNDNPLPRPSVPSKDSWIAGINREVAGILEIIYQNDSAYREVNAAICSGYYADERVLLKDLLFPENSDLYYSERFRVLNVSPGVFKRIFNETLASGDYPLLKRALAAEAEVGVVPKTTVVASELSLAGSAVLSGATATAIYFPYSTDFSPLSSQVVDVRNIPRATIVAADREADAAPGRAPSACALIGGSLCYKDVTVDDHYASSFPTHIVEAGARPVKIFLGDVPPSTMLTTKVFLGWARLTKQMDALISLTGNGGGSEIKVVRLSGYLKKVGEQVASVSGDLMTLDFSRSDIRNKKWKKVYTAWDADWQNDNLEQLIGVYEDDTKGTKTLSGSLNTTVNLPGSPSLGKAVGEVAYKVEVETQDDIILQRKLGRSSFFRDGMNNQAWGYMPDPTDFITAGKNWPIYDGGTIWQFTLPWRIN